MTGSPSLMAETARSRAAFLAYLVALTAGAFYVLVRTPIIAGDNDLWYHLSHGRYLFEVGRIPDTSYFSFLSPPRSWTDYYWAFQAAVYSIFQTGGYHGLLIWRGLLFVAFLGTVWALLRPRGRPRDPDSEHRRWFWAAVLTGLFLVHSFHKFLLVRPHAVSYLLLAVFLYVLEVRRAWILCLPVLAIAWTNFHGIEYPVMLLVTGAYLLDVLWRRRHAGKKNLREGGDPSDAVSRQGDRTAVQTLVALGLSMAAVFLTPHGARLIRVPFVSTEYASSYIQEHSQLGWREFVSYGLSPSGLSSLTAFNLLLLVALVGLATNAARRRLRWSHVILFAGGLLLLTKAIRLSQECALLALPLLRAGGAYLAEVRWPKVRTVTVALALVALSPPWIFLRERWPPAQQTYPLAPANLPHGIASFLRHVDSGGKVMNNPNVGGYLQWALPPGYQIFMDLEIPFLFTDEDMYEVASAFFDRRALRNFLDRHRPDYVAATLASANFGDLIAEHPRYVPVFFDDQGVLYADRGRHPEIAERYRIAAIDPYSLAGRRFSKLSDGERRAYFEELERISAVDGAISSVNQALAILHNLEGRFERGLEHAERVVAVDPRVASGHALRADALLGLDEIDKAVAAYRRALRLSTDDSERNSLYRSLALAWSRAGEARLAYEAFRRGVGRFNVEADVRDLFRLGALAAAAGEPGDAAKALRFALYKVPPEDRELRRRIEERLAVVGPAAAP